MKIEEMTKEELLAAREIHKKTGATLKVAKIDEHLGLPRRPGDTEGAKIGDISSNHVHEIVERSFDLENPDKIFKSDVATAYDLKMSTEMTWKEIGDRVGLKAQGLYAKVKKYARENELPYE